MQLTETLLLNMRCSILKLTKYMLQQPKTLVDAIKYFDNEAVCVKFVAMLKYGEEEKVFCPKCGSDNVVGLKTRKLFQCKERQCLKQFSVKVGTIFEGSNAPLTQWMSAMWLIANAKNGISSCELARALGCTQKTAWFMLHRIREAMRKNNERKLSGVVEADATYVGGLERFKHADKKEPSSFKRGRGKKTKTAVLGLLERGGEVRATVVDNEYGNAVEPVILNNIEEGSKLMTDGHSGYAFVANRNNFEHEFVDHVTEYVRGEVHTNSLENFWCLFKRAVKGTYTQIAPFHVDSYLDEQVFRFNNRKLNDFGRFALVVSQIFDKRLTYAELTGALPTQA